jgi:hypothetical protein
MKTATLKTRLEKIENLSRNSKAYQVVNDLINGRSNSMIFGLLIRSCKVYGRGRFTNNADYTYEIASLLKQIGVKFIKGNDSPRGGQAGNYIKIVTKIQ